MSQFRPPKQESLTENETITSFAKWQSNMIYHLSLNNEFAQFLASDWSKKSVTNRGLTNDPNDVAADERKTAVQKNITLDRMLGLITQFVPSLLRNDIIKKSTSLNWIWQRIRKYYAFSQSETNFLKLHLIKKQPDERYETFYQRIMAHLEDNLLTISSDLTHDGEKPTEDEEMSPTTERLAVYLWLNTIDERLPPYIARIYAHDLQSMTLKDIQPRISENMDSILQDLNTQEDIQIQYSRSSFPKRKEYNNHRRSHQSSQLKKSSTRSRTCPLCKSAGRQHVGHDASNCWFISKFDKQEIAKALQVLVTDDIESDFDNSDDHENEYTTQATSVCSSSQQISTVVNKVQCDRSPYFYVFIKHMTFMLVVDTGATSSMVSRAFITKSGITFKPTLHTARSVDKSPIGVQGEVTFNVQFGNLSLPITALVMDNLDSDILAGVPFCKENDVTVHLKNEEITIQNVRFPYGEKPKKHNQHDIYRTESFILRNDSKKVLMPGEFLEMHCDALDGYDDEIAIEPHLSSDEKNQWPDHSISRVIQGRVRIPNLSDDPIQLSASAHIARIRRVFIPDITPELHVQTTPLIKPTITENSTNSELVVVDPNRQLSSKEKQQFIQLNQLYAKVYTSNFGAYNDNSGRIRANVSIGTTMPPPKKGKLPFYNQSNLRALQEEADKLEALGVLVKPEDVNVEVKHVSPSFLKIKPDGSYRLVTAFNELGQYVHVPPTVSTSCSTILQKLGSWKYLIKSDLTKSFYQIPVSKKSMQFLGTVTPFKGIRVYARSAMGMPGSTETLQELISRVFGDYIQEGFVVFITDDLFVGADTIAELLLHWEKILKRCLDNNISLSPCKTLICPKSATMLGWLWNMGTITASPHKIAPLSTINAPKTCSAMRSFIGAFKALSRCIPNHTSYTSPLEDAIKGLQGSQHVTWTEELSSVFSQAQLVLKSPKILTLPRPEDQLVISVDGSVVKKGLGSTLFVVRDEKRFPAEFFSVKLKAYQLGWLPCEVEALGIETSIKGFGPYIRESNHTTEVRTDSKPCVQAYNKLCKGQFSASARVSTFLSTLANYNITLLHVKGKDNITSDFSSRHPQECSNKSCQICKFVEESCSSVVRGIQVNDVLSGSERMPFMNRTAWKSAQHDCSTLRRTYAHLTEGTRPSRKSRNLKDLRRYLNVATVDADGLLIVNKPDIFAVRRKLIIVPTDILPGIITALHIALDHPTKGQLGKVFDRYLFGLNSSAVIENVVKRCHQCNSLSKMPKEIFEQNSTPVPSSPGSYFAADIIRRAKQKILVTRDVFSSFTTAEFTIDETHTELRSALISTTNLLRSGKCIIHVDNASGLAKLKNDNILQSHAISMEFGNVKNINKNAVADKAIQELEAELLKHDPKCAGVNSKQLNLSLSTLNKRIRNRGLSSKEIIFRRDQYTGKQINYNDKEMAHQQRFIRDENHAPSARAKAKGGKLLNNNILPGDLVYIKGEGDKFHARDTYIVTSLLNGKANIQKMAGMKFASKQYQVPISHLFPTSIPDNQKSNGKQQTDSENDSDDDMPSAELLPQNEDRRVEHPENELMEDTDTEELDDISLDAAQYTSRYPQRIRKEPVRYANEWQADK